MSAQSGAQDRCVPRDVAEEGKGKHPQVKPCTKEDPRYFCCGVGGLSPCHINSLYLRKHFTAINMVPGPSKHSSIVDGHTNICESFWGSCSH